ncbi:MAG TPA: multicopper oxidase domain-containing protein [Actinomycetota bacterium]
MTDRFHKSALAAAAVALALTVAACATSSTGDSSASDGTVDVSLQEFSITPAQIEVPAGPSLTFNVNNQGTVPHTFAVETGSRTYETPMIDGGASTTLRVDGLAPGIYQLLCTVAGHADLGMVAQLVVGEAEGAADASGGPGSSMGSMMGGGMTAEEMARGHKESVEAFPAETRGRGNLPLRPTIQGGVKVFELTATETKWETEPGTFVDAMAYNGQIPGPEIRVHSGDRVRIVLSNQMSQPTTLHMHGLTVPNRADGVPYITQDPIMPGGYYVYAFRVTDSPGMYVFHSHFNSTEQVGKGLYGAFIVEPRGGFGFDVEATVFLGDGPTGYVLNGKGFPATQPIVASRGDDVLIHLANDGAMIHPMHLHGYHFEVIAQDGFLLAQPYMADTLMIAPGQRYDVVVKANYPGAWAFHCHILPHVEGPGGMFGMVTALVVQ